MRILQANRDQADAASIELMLQSEGFNVYTTDLGAEAVDLAKMYDYDICLLSTMRDLTDCDMVKSLRLAKVKTPIIVISTRSDTATITRALDLGADDYLLAPFASGELIARIHAITRRSKGHAHSLVQVGPLAINLTTHSVTVAGGPLHLTGKEYAMLELLALRKGSLITKEMFLNHLYGGMDEPEIKIIDVFICKLRKKLREHFGLIETVWGRGYVLRDPAAVASAGSEDVRDFTDDPPTGRVARRTLNEYKASPEGLAAVKSPSLVPAAGANGGRE